MLYNADADRVNGFLYRNLSFFNEQHELNAIFITHCYFTGTQITYKQCYVGLMLWVGLTLHASSTVALTLGKV